MEKAITHGLNVTSRYPSNWLSEFDVTKYDYQEWLHTLKLDYLIIYIYATVWVHSNYFLAIITILYDSSDIE